MSADRDTQPLPVLPDALTWVQLWRWRLGYGEKARRLLSEGDALFIQLCRAPPHYREVITDRYTGKQY